MFFFVICDMFMGLANCELMYEKLANLQWEIKKKKRKVD